MVKYNTSLFGLIFINLFAIIFSCKPDRLASTDNPTGSSTINYGDSILYLKPNINDYTITPKPMNKPGKFYSYPDGLDLNTLTGAIKISSSETGFRYKIMFVPDGTTDTVSTKIVLSGISYKDYYHIQTVNDTLSRPFYNANFSNFNMPCTNNGCVFDVGGSARADGLAIDPNTGIINLKKSIQNGFFGSSTPNNGAQKELLLTYQLNDLSNKATNSIKIKLYYFNTRNDVDNNLSQLVIDRNDMFLRMATTNSIINDLGRNINASKPRPPCIIILGT